MPKVSEKFGAAVRELLDSRGLTLRAASLKTGVDHTTIKQMRDGLVPKKGIVIDFAQGMDENINHWLELAGYEPIPPRLIRGGLEPVQVYLRKTHGHKLSDEEIEAILRVIEEIEEKGESAS